VLLHHLGVSSFFFTMEEGNISLTMRSRLNAIWHRASPATLEYTSWTATCIDALERQHKTDGDLVLCWLVRLGHVVEEVSSWNRGQLDRGQSEQQTKFLLLGLESQLREYQRKILPNISTNRIEPPCSSPAILILVS
jgi:hypothetical protein